MAIGCLNATFFALPALTLVNLGSRQVWMSFFSYFTPSSFAPLVLFFFVYLSTSHRPLSLPLFFALFFVRSFLLLTLWVRFSSSDPVGTFSSGLFLFSSCQSSDPAGTFVLASVGVVQPYTLIDGDPRESYLYAFICFLYFRFFFFAPLSAVIA